PSDGDGARRLLRRLLLRPHAPAVRARPDEPRLDGARRRARLRREGPAAGRPPAAGGRGGARGGGAVGRDRARDRPRADAPDGDEQRWPLSRAGAWRGRTSSPATATRSGRAGASTGARAAGRRTAS